MRGVEKIIAVLLLFVAIAIPACAQKEAQAASAIPELKAKTTTTATGLAYQDAKVGSGASPVKGKLVKVHVDEGRWQAAPDDPGKARIWRSWRGRSDSSQCYPDL
jgi:hypothetical protein